MSDLNFSASVDIRQFRADIESMRRDILDLNNTVSRETNKMDSSFKNLSLGIAGYFSAQALLGFTQQLINVRGEFQKTEIAFQTMLGNADQAKELMGKMVDLVAKTPFSLQDVSNGAKQLLAFQVPANEVVDTLTRMGNIAAGLSVPLSRINLVYGQVKAKGKLAGDDLRQFTEAGIPMVAELAKKFGTSTAAITEMISAGKIGFNDVKEVLFSLTNEGGMFFNLMEKQSTSLSGKISNLGDAFNQMLNKIGEGNEGVLADGIDGLAYLVEHYQDVVDILTVLVATYGTYRAALIATIAIQRASIMAGNIQAFFQLAGSIRSAKDAQLLFNTVTKANPYVVAATALAALTTAVYVYYNRVSDAERAQQELNAEIAKQQAPLAATKIKIESLVSAIKSENSSNSQRAAWLKQIQSLSNGRLDQLTVEQIRTNKASSAINGYIQQLYKEAEVKAYLQKITENTEKRDELRAKLKTKLSASDLLDDLTDLSTTHKGKDGKSLSTKERRDIRIINEINAISGAIQDAKNKVDKITKDGVNITDAVIPEPAVIKDKVEKTKKEVEKIYAENTLKGLQQRVDKFRAIMDTSVIGSNTFNNAKSMMEAYQKKLDELTKSTEKKSFDEEISELERQWNIRYQLAEKYGEDVAKAQFPDLKGSSYFDEINKKFAPLDKDFKAGIVLSDEDLKKYETLKKILDSLNGVKDPLTNFKDGLDAELAKLETFAEKQEYLNKQMYSADMMSGKGIDDGRKAELVKRQDDLKKQWQDYYQSILTEQKTFEEKSIALEKEYSQVKATPEYQNASSSEKAKIDKHFTDELSNLSLEAIKSSKEWEVAFGEMENYSKVALERILASLLEFKSKSAGKLKPTELRELEEAINRVQLASSKVGNPNVAKSFSDWRNAAETAKNTQLEYNEAVRQSGVNSEQAKAAAQMMISAQENLSNSQKKLIGDINNYKDKLNSIGEIASGVGDIFVTLGGDMDSAFGDFLVNIQKSIEGLNQFADGAIQAIQGFASGNILQGIAGAIKAIGGLIKSVSGWLNGDNKKERNIKKQAAALKQLEQAYNDLSFAAERALGSQKYTSQVDVIRNLEQQKAALQGMINTESSKKKSDSGKIQEWQAQIQSLNQSIQKIKDDIIKDVLQTDASSLAGQLTDALVDAFEKGEDAAKSLDKVANDVFKNMVKNALQMRMQDALKPILDDILAAAGFDKEGKGSFRAFTPEQLAEFKKRIAEAGLAEMDFLKSMGSLFDDGVSASNLQGAIKGVTEETAGIIAGQMNAIRIMQAEMFQIAKDNQLVFVNQLLQLTQIEINTSYLKLIYTILNKGGNDELRAGGLI